MPESRTLQVATPTDTTIVMTRTFEAPRRLVWDAMTKPELLRRWMFCPPGWSWAECEMDVRVGGAYRWVWNGPDGRPALSITGEHLEVTPPARIVHTERMEMGPGADGGECGSEGESHGWPSVVVTIELDERGDHTRMTLTISCPTKEVRDTMLASGMERGMEAGYMALDRMLAESARC